MMMMMVKRYSDRQRERGGAMESFWTSAFCHRLKTAAANRIIFFFFLFLFVTVFNGTFRLEFGEKKCVLRWIFGFR